MFSFSFVAVDHKELKEGAEFGDMKVRDVPHQVPSGYGGFSGQVQRRACAMAAPQMAMCAAPPGGGMQMQMQMQRMQPQNYSYCRAMPQMQQMTQQSARVSTVSLHVHLFFSSKTRALQCTVDVYHTMLLLLLLFLLFFEVLKILDKNLKLL